MSVVAQPGVGAARYVGSRVQRKEDPRLLTGRGQFVDDIALPGMLHCAFVRSPIARGTIRSIDRAAALDLPGVHAVYTAEDLAAQPVTMLSFYLVASDVPMAPLADGHVANAGEPVALVIADDRYIAEDAAALVEVEYDEQVPVVSISDAMTGPAIHPGREDNVAAEMGDEDIDEELRSALDNAAHLIEHRVTHQRVSHSPMETRGVVASPGGPEELTLYITCQSPHMVARWVGLALGLPSKAIRVIAKDVGGAFGLKNHPWKEEMAVIVAAMLIGRPLKWIEDRWESLTASNQAREQDVVLKVGFDETGRLVGSHADYSINNGAYPQGADANIAVHMFLWAAYKLPLYGFHSRGWYTNTNGLAAYRGPWAMESLVRETALDKAARAMGIDPVELRRRNLIGLADQPHTTAMGLELTDVTPAECLEHLLAHVDVAAFRREQAAARAEGRYLGLGIATYIEPTGAAGSIASMTGELAQIRIEPEGKVTASLSTHSQGHGTATTMAQLIADTLGVAYEDVTVFEGDSQHGGFSPGAAGSRQGVIAGGAAIETARILKAKVQTLAAHLLNASPDAIRIEGGMVHVDGAEPMSRSLREIAGIAYGEPDRLPPGFESGLEAQHRYQPPPITYTSAAHACVVEVDPATGFVTINRWVSCEDCGTIINPAVVEGQIAGGLAQGIGTVLLEEVGYDAQGNATAATYKDYLLPAISDIPEIEFLHLCTPSASTGGIRGVGEGGAIIGPPTLVNAIADALAPFGEIPLTLPLSPTRLLSVIEGRDLGARKPVASANVHPQPDVTPHDPGAADDLPAPDAAMLPGGPAALEAAASQPESGPAGDWALVLKSPVGPQPMTGHFETEGTALSGYLASSEGRQDFTGTIEGNRLLFDLKVVKPMKITLKYDLVVTGDTIAGTCKMGIFGKAKVTGERRF